MMLALLLARYGLDVTVMEKHADFLRDFRGDTVHASTLRIIDELGLSDEFADLPHRMIDHVNAVIGDTTVRMDLRRLPGAHQHIALVPQWDFLELLASAASREPGFRLLRSTEVLAPIRTHGRVTGVRYRDADGTERDMAADLVVACDGRASALRAAAGLVPRNFGAPMDVWWFRLPRYPDDPVGLNGRFADGHGCALIDRGDYFQVAYLIRKGTDAALRAEGIESLQRRMASLVPWVAERTATLTSFDDVKLLDVQLNRLRRWYVDGLLFIGDAAHAMSPIGGVGINLAIADAVAAARYLAEPLRGGTVTTRELARLQARRWLPAALIQRVQRTIQDRAIAGAISTGDDRMGPEAPIAVRIANRLPALRRAAAYGVAIGPLPEHAPAWARR
jgi:2-polyprenyl-6-methoxyphenol hydroxylase-like FAD-dependent oxidoreductase